MAQEEFEWGDFGDDLYTTPQVVVQRPSPPTLNPVPVSDDADPLDKDEEERRIKAFVETTALDWQHQVQAGSGSQSQLRGFKKGGMVWRRLARKTPPQGYVCHRCNEAGHFIQHCPTNGDPDYDVKRVRPPTGIPRSMLRVSPDGSYALRSGEVAALEPDEAAFEKEMEGLPSSSTRPVTHIPPELHCPLCKLVMREAVMTSKCCFESFCDGCIRGYIISNTKCICGAADILADDLVINKTLRALISRMLGSPSPSSCTSVITDVQSACCVVQQKAPSPEQERRPQALSRHNQDHPGSTSVIGIGIEGRKRPSDEQHNCRKRPSCSRNVDESQGARNYVWPPPTPFVM